MKTNKIYTKLYNLLLNMDATSYFKRKIVIILNIIRQRKISKTNNFADMPLIKTFIDGKEIIVPLSHNLAFYKKWFADYDKHIIAICNFLISQKGYFNFIDVGANVGDTIINIDITEHAKYLLIEGADEFFPLIQENLRNHKYNYKAINCILGDNNVNSDSYDIEYNISSARLIKNKNLSSDKKIYTLDEIVAQEKFEPTILKIDTDGFDLKVLRGSQWILTNYKPVIFFEWCSELLIKNGEDPTSIFDYLNSMGYEKCLLYDNYGSALLFLETTDKANLEMLKNYSCNSQKQICYYDVLLFHKDDSLCIEDFIRES